MDQAIYAKYKVQLTSIYILNTERGTEETIKYFDLDVVPGGITLATTYKIIDSVKDSNTW